MGTPGTPAKHQEEFEAMPTFFTPFSLLSQHQAAASPGVATPRASAPVKVDTSLVDEPGSVGASRLAYLDPGVGHVVTGAFVRPTGGGTKVELMRAQDVNWHCWRNTVAPAVDGSAYERCTNNGEPTIVERAPVDVGGELAYSHRPALRIKGDTLTKVGAGVSQLQGELLVARSVDVASLANFGLFTSDVEDVNAVAGKLLAELELRRSGGLYALGTTAGGGVVSVRGVTFAAASPFGAIWVRDSDIGNSSDQIPTSFASNQSYRYNFHPAYFHVRADSARAALSNGPWKSAIDTRAGALSIYKSTKDWTHSAWRLSYDGVAFDVVIDHNGITGLRRPLEVWQSVMVPRILNNAQTSTWRTYVTPGAVRVYEPAGSIAHYRYMDFALFLEAYSADVALPYVQHAQS